MQPRDSLRKLIVLGGLVFFLGKLNAQMTVDVFPGWDGTAVSSRWIPLVVEIANQGFPSAGWIEVWEGSSLPRQVALATVDIPSQTRKRMWIYVPPSNLGGMSGLCKVRVVDERQRVLRETRAPIDMQNLPTGLVAESIPAGWLKMGLNPSLRVKPFFEWRSTRILKQHLPDSAVGYDGLDALHLGWAEVDDLVETQRQALLDWVWAGGHLMVSAEDPLAWSRQSWWDSILPVKVSEQRTVADLVPLQTWLQSVRERHSQAFPGNQPSSSKTAPLQLSEALVGTGPLLRGGVLIEREGVPLVAETRLGRGWVTQMLFHPGREPFRGWSERSLFWMFLLLRTREHSDRQLVAIEKQPPGSKVDAPAPGSRKSPGRLYLGQILDSIGVQLLSTRQQLQLPWRLFSVLFVIYVLLIGPFDYLYLKRKHRLVWTWITFPIYVLGATSLIYWLGYWANHGESEWRQWSVVDWLADGRRQRVTTQVRFFSARNGAYRWGDRPELTSHVREVEESSLQAAPSENLVAMTPSGSRVEMSVPIWSSRSFLGRFNQPGVLLRAVYDRENATLTLTNPTAVPWQGCRWITDARAYRALGQLRGGETRTWRLKDLPVNPVDTENLTSYRYPAHLSRGTEEIPDDKRANLIQSLFFFPFLDPECQAGSIGEGMDLSGGWQAGDAVFLAESEAPSGWPWVLDFQPRRWTHRVTHRICFPAPIPRPSSMNEAPSSSP